MVRDAVCSVESYPGWIRVRNLIGHVGHDFNNFATLGRQNVGTVVEVLIDFRAIASMPDAFWINGYKVDGEGLGLPEHSINGIERRAMWSQVLTTTICVYPTAPSERRPEHYRFASINCDRIVHNDEIDSFTASGDAC